MRTKSGSILGNGSDSLALDCTLYFLFLLRALNYVDAITNTKFEPLSYSTTKATVGCNTRPVSQNSDIMFTPTFYLSQEHLQRQPSEQSSAHHSTHGAPDCHWTSQIASLVACGGDIECLLLHAGAAEQEGREAELGKLM